jgi:hypothetical protein
MAAKFSLDEMEELKELVQHWFNAAPEKMTGCSWPTDMSKPPEHLRVCPSCRTRKLLTPGYYLKPNVGG